MITYLIEETLRQAANFPAVLVRDDWLLGAVAVQQVQTFLYQLFAESNKPAPPTGPKQWSSKLTSSQREVLSGLPAAAGGLGAGRTRSGARRVLSRGPADRRAQRHPLAVPPRASRPGLPA